MANRPGITARLLDSAVAVLNGAIGDHLERTGNGLATPMALLHAGRPLILVREQLARLSPEATPQVVVLVHGLMCTEAVWRFRVPGERGRARDYGTLLAEDLGCTPLYLRYNTGLPIADNGAALSALLEALVGAYPVAVEEILLVGHSLGGLVVRSACEVARAERRAWLDLVRRIISLDTPHLGSPLERLGRVAAALLRAVDDPSTRLAAEIGDLRSAGIKDLGDADLRHEDRERRRPGLRPAAWRHPVQFPGGIAHLAIAGTGRPARRRTARFGDLLVPLPSATAQDQPAAPTRVMVFDGLGHLKLARDPGVYAQVRAWCEGER